MSGDMAVSKVDGAGASERAISQSYNNYNPTSDPLWLKTAFDEELKKHVNNSNVSVFIPGYGAGGI